MFELLSTDFLETKSMKTRGVDGWKSIKANLFKTSWENKCLLLPPAIQIELKREHALFSSV